ncbi:MAG: hypothetical protein ABI432_05790 [Flavobacteriales bacterium]
MRTHGLAKLVLLALTFSGTPILCAQNLVTDPGLEDTLKCPLSIGRFYHPTNANERYIKDWRATTLASPDYHNTCGFNGYMPRTGEGYAGIILYDPTEYREYITALFDAPMEAGQCYYVECWVALSSGSTMAVDEFQFHFSNGVPLDMTFPPPGPLALTAHLQAEAAPTSTGYQRICGFYTAAGGENAMTFGNFMDNANTTLTQVSAVGQVQSYYYIDDVTVTLLDLGPDLVICAGQQETIVPNVQCAELTYAWSDGSDAQTLSTGTAGIVSLTISGNGSCAATDEVLITVDPCAGVEEITPRAVTLAPVPVRAGEALRITGLRSADVRAIHSMDGRLCNAAVLDAGKDVLVNTGALAPGSYVLHTKDGRAWRFAVE